MLDILGGASECTVEQTMRVLGFFNRTKLLQIHLIRYLRSTVTAKTYLSNTSTYMNNYFVIALSILLFISCIACTSKQTDLTNKYRIEGTVTDPSLNGQFVYLYNYDIEENTPRDSARIMENTFLFTGVQKQPILAQISLASHAATVSNLNTNRKHHQVKPGEVVPYTSTFVLANNSLTLLLDTFSVVSGTSENNSLQALLETINRIKNKSAYLNLNFEAYRNLSPQQQNDLEEELSIYTEQRINSGRKYINNHLNQLTGGYVFWRFRGFLETDEQTNMLLLSDSTFKSVPGINKILQEQNRRESLAIGKPFIDFSMNDTTGTPRYLSEFVGKGNYVLLEFWASWCHPCCKKIPQLINLYNKHHNNGFDIIGISLDRDKKAWVHMINKTGMPWIQLSDLKGWGNDGSLLYGETGIPPSFLFDPKGLIIAKDLSEKELDKLLSK